MKAGYFRRRVSKVSLRAPSSLKVTLPGTKRTWSLSDRRLTGTIKQQKHIVCILNILNHHSCVLRFHSLPPPAHISFQIVPYLDEQSSRRTTDFSSSNLHSSACVQLQFEASEGRKLKVWCLESGQNVVLWRRRSSFCPGSCMICFHEVPRSPLNQAGGSFLFFFSLRSDLSSGGFQPGMVQRVSVGHF